ncbi:phenylacetate--CoA ligase family protein, partial [Candidatus Pacearchaeota archaeon]|nr:phenylacetate--CoA ligase family protein [Candidatus Pacearchaeota archaeon]
MNWRKPVIYALLYLTGSKIPKHLSEIKKLDKLPKDKLKKYQEEKLKKILLHSWKNVPYYTKVLEKAKVVVNGKVHLDNFSKIPILTKEILRKEKENMYSKDYKKRGFYENTSGGSTGEPAKFIQDKDFLDWEIANKIFLKLVAGQGVGDKELRFWASERDLFEGKETLKIRLRNWLYNRKEFNTFKMSDKEMKQYVKDWNKYNPKWIESYVQSIYEFARFIKKNNLKIKSPKNGILTSAGTLYPEMKKLIEEVFNCSVYNRYGSREVGDMAFGKDKLKLSLWIHKFETKKNGEVLITSLTNYSMPLIRHAMGDIAEVDNEFELKNVLGRVNNIIETSNGKLDSTSIIAGLFFDLKGNLFTSFSKYQLTQKKKDEFELKIIISDKEKWKLEKKAIDEVMKKILGEKVKFRFNEVKEINPLKSGKYEY